MLDPNHGIELIARVTTWNVMNDGYIQMFVALQWFIRHYQNDASMLGLLPKYNKVCKSHKTVLVSLSCVLPQ